MRKYAEADRIARLLKRDVHFEVKEKERTCHLNDEGVREAEKIAGLESFYTPGNMEWPHLIDNALKAHHLYKRDRDYVVQPDGEVVIVDEFTGRLMIGRQWSDGLHQAVEAKERVKVKEENQTLATITLAELLQALQEAGGHDRHGHDRGDRVLQGLRPRRHRDPDQPAAGAGQLSRRDLPVRAREDGGDPRRDQGGQRDAAGRSWSARPRSRSRKSWRRCSKRYGIPHQVLNAKYHEREAEIVAQAGRRGAVTIATNMAGRGTDIILGGNPEFMAWADLKRLTDEDGRPLYPTRLDVPKEVWDEAVARYEPEMKAEGREVAAVGGLHIIGTERHESRRIDNQLRGRAGRQGDPGSSRFFLSLEDDLMRKFAGEWVSAVLTRLGMQEGEAIESKMVSRRIEGAQKKVEERNFDIRKNLLEYDEVMDEQRKRVYSFRQSLLEGAPPKEMILEMIDSQIEDAATRFLADDYGAASFAEWVGQRAGGRAHGARHQRGELRGRRGDRQDQGRAPAPRDDPPGDGGKPARRRRSLGMDLAGPGELGQHPVRAQPQGKRPQEVSPSPTARNSSSGHDDLEEFLNEKAVESLQKIDLSPAREFLQPDWGRRSLSGWVHHKFALAIDPASWAELDRAEIVRRIQAQARELYTPEGSRAAGADRPDAISWATARSHQTPRYDREGLAAWARARYQTPDRRRRAAPLAPFTRSRRC